jgi:hypothetical protein
VQCCDNSDGHRSSQRRVCPYRVRVVRRIALCVGVRHSNHRHDHNRQRCSWEIAKNKNKTKNKKTPCESARHKSTPKSDVTAPRRPDRQFATCILACTFTSIKQSISYTVGYKKRLKLHHASNKKDKYRLVCLLKSLSQSVSQSIGHPVSSPQRRSDIMLA